MRRSRITVAAAGSATLLLILLWLRAEPVHFTSNGGPEASGVLAGFATDFVPNEGQWDGPFEYRVELGGMTAFLEERGWTLALLDAEKRMGAAVRMRFAACGEGVRLEPEGRRREHHNYFLGSNPERWRTGVPLYSSLVYQDVYPGVDVRAHEKDGHLEYDLVLEPGADLGEVEVAVEGAAPLRIDEQGALVIDTTVGPLTQPVPVTWETGVDGEKRELACRYVLLAPDRFGFEVEGRDDGFALTIDPGLLYSTYIDGIGVGSTVFKGVSVDAKGVITCIGTTTSQNYPTTTGAYDLTYNGGFSDVVVSRLDPSKTGSAQLLNSTFVGGLAEENPTDLCGKDSGVVTVTGATNSPDFPTTPGAYDTTFRGGMFTRDAFVFRLDPTQAGTAQLAYSTYLGGSDDEEPASVDVDASGVITVAGAASSSLPTTAGAYDTSYNGGVDAFVSQLDPSLTGAAQLIYSTYLGGAAWDFGFS